jgi:DNA-binding CsgD family transcriptional regulator
MPHNLQRPTELPKLSVRELEVLTWAARGKTFAEISTLLSISVDTVKDHIERVSKKLNTKNKTHTVAFSVALGIVKLFADTPPKVE